MMALGDDGCVGIAVADGVDGKNGILWLEEDCQTGESSFGISILCRF